jgi:cytochrome c biogenesis factor
VKEYDINESTKSLSLGTDVDSLSKITKEEEAEVSTGKRQKSVLIFLRSSRFYIRVIAVLIMIVSLALILTAIISFANAQKKAGNPLNNVSKSATITDHPCVVFSGVAAMNLVFSISILCLSCMSSKVGLAAYENITE